MRIAIALSLALLALSACGSPRKPSVSPSTAEGLSSLKYPKDAEYGPDLDVLVRDLGRRVRLVNRTARSYADRQLWINRQYVRRVSRITIGPNNVYPLTSFVNHYGQAFAVPGFLRPDAGTPVVLAELYDPRTGIRNRLLILKINKPVTGVENQQ